jgi:predicted glycogen debranching enzyme
VKPSEWFVPNGLGGYSGGTLEGPPSRRFHGALIAAFPTGRVLAVGPVFDLEKVNGVHLKHGLPIFDCGDVLKSICMPHERNLTIIAYRAVRDCAFEIKPSFQTRPHEGRVDAPPRDYPVNLDGAICEIDRGSSMPVLLIASKGEWRAIHEERQVEYAIERDRGYDFRGTLVVPCALSVRLKKSEELTLALTTDPKEPSLNAAQLRDKEIERRRALAEPLKLAADAFVVRKLTGGPEDRTVIAGYPWFTDWGRDTMISLEGLCLTTGRFDTAARILRTFASHIRDGLIPNLFPEGESQGLYHTADASLWFFHAVQRYTQLSGDRELLEELLPKLRGILDAHLAGTKFGIGVDPRDGLLKQGAEGYQLTWMDAKVGDFVVTPRRGKAVEINALFYNALRLYESWDAPIGNAAAQLRKSFNERFPYRDFLKDVLDPDDVQLRPNQVFAISLPHPVLDEKYWPGVMRKVQQELWTPVGLRSLGPREKDYKPRYEGDLPTRDRAYHQGTVWAWLMGPFVDAWRKTFPDQPPPQEHLAEQLNEFALGQIAEIFDGDAPHTPRGCYAQAWSVAEALRLHAHL